MVQSSRLIQCLVWRTRSGSGKNDELRRMSAMSANIGGRNEFRMSDKGTMDGD